MAARKIVCEPLTITGSIGVITGKFNLAELYKRVGYAKTSISKGKWSELLNDEKPFTMEEKAFFDLQAQHAYRSFRDKVCAPPPLPPHPQPFMRFTRLKIYLYPCNLAQAEREP